MPLLDHFRPPLSLRRHWHSFHNAWATYLAADLNARLPSGYFAEPNVQFGVEIDVATFDDVLPVSAEAMAPLPVAGVKGAWVAPPPTQSLPISLLTEVVEVHLYASTGGPSLAGAIELVSPGNKDRPEQREAFASKCAAYLQQGVGLAIVDVVTARSANLHALLLSRLRADADAEERRPDLYAVAYRAIEREEGPCLDVWQETLAIGAELPTLPLWLAGNLCLPVDLRATYERTCREQRIV